MGRFQIPHVPLRVEVLGPYDARDQSYIGLYLSKVPILVEIEALILFLCIPNSPSVFTRCYHLQAKPTAVVSLLGLEVIV